MSRWTTLVGALLLATAVRAQSFEVVHTFSHNDGYPFSGLTSAADGSFYGTTERGGRFAKGSISRLFPDGLGGYCPNNPNTRGQMAVFLTKTFALP